MKVLKDSDDNFIIYLLRQDNHYDIDHKSEIIKAVKETVLKANKIYHLNLKGFYKVRVYLNKKMGFVIEIISIDDISINNAIDLRVLVYFDQEFYIEVDNFDFLPPNKKVVYVNNKFYIDSNSLNSREIASLLEFGEVIYKVEEIDNFHLGRVIMN